MNGRPSSGADHLGHLELVEEEVDVRGLRLSIERPLEPAALVSEEAFAENEFLPYWAELWPSSLRLAEALPEPLAARRVVELGCGLGIPSLVAASRGAEVLATDWAPDAIGLLEHNAARNGVAIETFVVDWFEPAELIGRGPFELALAADVLYEARNVAALLALLPRLAPVILLADPGRDHARAFLEAVGPAFSDRDLGAGVHRLDAVGEPSR